MTDRNKNAEGDECGDHRPSEETLMRSSLTERQP